MSRFMVITSEHVILIEPDTKHYGWGVIRFIARLQDLEFWSHAHAANQPTTPAIPRKEKDDLQSIYIYFRRYQMSSSMIESSYSRSQSIVIRFSFDDQIRCYAAKQHLTKAQSKVRERKISAIVRIIDLNSYESNTRESSSMSAKSEQTRPKTAKPGESNNRKKNHNQHPLLSRSLAVPGGAVLSSSLASPHIDSSQFSSASALAKFEMLNKTKYAYPAASKIKSTNAKSSDSEMKRKKKLKNPKELLPDRNEDGIPLNDLSPKTVRRNNSPLVNNTEHIDIEDKTSMECGGKEELHPSGQDQMAPENNSGRLRSCTQTETIDI